MRLAGWWVVVIRHLGVPSGDVRDTPEVTRRASATNHGRGPPASSGRPICCILQSLSRSTQQCGDPRIESDTPVHRDAGAGPADHIALAMALDAAGEKRTVSLQRLALDTEARPAAGAPRHHAGPRN